jgi:flagellar biosynthesis GTPase FlhF
MKIPKMLKQVDEFLDAGKKKKHDQKDAIKEVLKSLKHKHNACKDKMKTEKDENKRKRMEKELDIIWAQRKKGLNALKKLVKD